MTSWSTLEAELARDYLRTIGDWRRFDDMTDVEIVAAARDLHPAFPGSWSEIKVVLSTLARSGRLSYDDLEALLRRAGVSNAGWAIATANNVGVIDQYGTGGGRSAKYGINDLGERTLAALSGTPDGQAVQDALKAINRHRRKFGERPLDPVASGWTEDDVLDEHRRIFGSRRSNRGRAKSDRGRPKKPVRQFTEQPGLTEDELDEWYREQEGHLRYANRDKPREFYVELSHRPGGWFWVIGEEGHSRWLFSGENVRSAALAEMLARIRLHDYLRRHGIDERQVTTRVWDADVGSMTERLRNAF